MENKAYETSNGSLEMVVGMNGDANGRANGDANGGVNGDANGGVTDTRRLERVLSVPEEVEVRREKERARTPIRYVSWIVNRPIAWFRKSMILCIM